MARTRSRLTHLVCSTGRGLILGALIGVFLPTAQGAEPQPVAAHAPLPVVHPVLACAALAKADLAAAVGAAVTLRAATVDTPKGQYCQVTGTIAPAVGFEVDLPLAKWTQRYLQAGCGGLCGNINASIGNAGTCLPATDGEFVVAASDLGHRGMMMSPAEGDFGKDPQALIDFAYRANHVTALAAKALIRAYYGQGPRYAYFSGCSDGGREALMEAQRYPGDFDGISAGAPAMLFTVQNSFWHAWTIAANRDAAGQPVLYADKLPVLHAAVIAHCDALDGTQDGLLADPRACKVDPSWVLCPADRPDTSSCLTRAEWQVAARLYEGPDDGAGHRFLPGGSQPGSETQWDFIPQRPGPNARPWDGGFGANMLRSMTHVIYRDPTAQDGDPALFPFTTAQFARASRFHDLLDASDPDLAAFAGHGGKLLLWHGWSDNSIAPMISVAYYQAVQRQMGADLADSFVRLFLLPGVGHCGGGDGFAQIDTLTPLMAWVEAATAPGVLVADKVADRRLGPPPGAAANDRAGPANGADGRGGMGMGMPRSVAPYAPAPQASLATRPIYAFPAFASYAGSGSPGLAANYVRTAASAGAAPASWFGQTLLQPGPNPDFAVQGGVLVR